MDPEDPDSDPNHSQNLITSFFYHFGHILKISSKSIHKFLIYLVHKQTNRRTDKPRRKHNLLGEGKKYIVMCWVLKTTKLYVTEYGLNFEQIKPNRLELFGFNIIQYLLYSITLGTFSDEEK